MDINIAKLEDWKILLALIVILLPLFIISLGQSSMWDLDEGVYSEISREMVLRGDYINTFYNYSPRFDKPPLVLWVTAFFYKVFGENEFTTRIGIVIFSIANLVLLYFFAKRLFTKKTAILSVIILATSFQYLIQSRLIYMDVPLTLFLMMSLYFFHLGYHDDRKYYIWMGLALGLGTMVKGPVALGLPCLIYMIYLGPVKFFKEFKYKFTWYAALIYFVVALPWHILLYLNYGQEFISDLFGYHMLTRFSTAIESHGGPWFYYIFIILLGLFPWSAFIPWIYSILKHKWGEQKETFKLLVIWFAVIFVFFSIASTKLPGYILPTYPVFAMLIAYWWTSISANTVPRKKFLISNLIIVLLGVVILAGLFYIRPMVINDYPDFSGLLKVLFTFPAIFIGGGLLALIIIYNLKSTFKTFLVFALISYLSLFIVNVAVVPAADQFKVARPLAEAIPGGGQEEFKVASTLDTEPASLVFYSKRKVDYLSLEELKQFINKNKDYYVYLDQEDYDTLQEEGYDLVILKKYQNALIAKNSE